MKFKDIQAGDLLWHTAQPGVFLVCLIFEGGALVVDLMGPNKKDPLPLGLILPRDSDNWIVDDKNAKLTTDEKGVLEERLLALEMIKE